MTLKVFCKVLFFTLWNYCNLEHYWKRFSANGRSVIVTQGTVEKVTHNLLAAFWPSTTPNSMTWTISSQLWQIIFSSCSWWQVSGNAASKVNFAVVETQVSTIAQITMFLRLEMFIGKGFFLQYGRPSLHSSDLTIRVASCMRCGYLKAGDADLASFQHTALSVLCSAMCFHTNSLCTG